MQSARPYHILFGTSGQLLADQLALKLKTEFICHQQLEPLFKFFIFFKDSAGKNEWRHE